MSHGRRFLLVLLISVLFGFHLFVPASYSQGTNHAVLLNGTSAYVDVPYNANLNITGALTLEAWVKTSSTSYQHVLERGDWFQNQMSYDLTVAEGKVRMDIMQSNGSYVAVLGNTVMSLNTWHHIAGVYDGSQMRVYLDGVLDGTATATMAPGNNSTGLRIGKSSFLYFPNYFNGRIDEVRVSNAAVYSSNFTPNAHLTATSSTKGLWKFDNDTTNDGSSSAANGSLQGGASYSTDVPTGSGGGAQVPVAVANGPYSAQLAQPVSFSSGGSFDPDGTISSYHWNFGDGTSANSANASHAYQTAGLFTATLTVTDNSGLRSSATASVSINGSSQARLDPLNQIGGGGENPLSRNFNWSVSLLRLPGRAGMDLGLTLSYNSLVWTKNGSYISFDDDRGFPSPGFRLGFPVLQPIYYNAEVGKYAFLLISPDGSRTELRQVDTSTRYEAADSSHLLLDTNGMTLSTANGTQFTYVPMGSEYNCTKITDRNGNYLTINYTSLGRIDTIIDTLARSIKFNYDNGRLTSITQVWNQGSVNAVTHTWATFTYSDTTIVTNFNGLNVYGPTNNSTIKTLSQVSLADGSHSDFSYTSWGQVWKVSGYAADNHLLNHRAYKLPGSPLLPTSPQTDCPRFTERRDWAQYWNGDTDGTPASNEEAVVMFADPVTGTWTMPDNTQQSGIQAQVTTPDGTSNKIYFIGTAGSSSGWRRGLPALVETYTGPNWRRKVMTTWTQDDTSVSYPLNPRVIETNIYDPESNRARTQITYQKFTFVDQMSCYLPRDTYEYAADAATVLRSSQTDYNTDASYTSRRILGLVSEKRLYESNVSSGGTLVSKIAFNYDESGSIPDDANGLVQHDNQHYSKSFVIGRGNLSTVKRYDVNNTSLFTLTNLKYNTAGAVISSKDASNHETTIGYADSFSDGNNGRNTLAYPTTMTDPDGYSSTAKYNFDFGAVTNRQTPQTNTTQNLPGPEQSWTYDTLGRLQQITNLVNNAYTRFEYPTSQIRVDTYSTIQEGKGEAHSFTINDGLGRVVAAATDHPGSVGGFSGQKFVYDAMGRVIKTSNPTETSAVDAPSQWNTAGDDASAGWIYVERTYDWKGRPLVTTNQDGTTSTASYSGCGCAGGEVVTLTDEGTIDGGIAKRRQQKIYSDVFGRTRKTEVLNWENGSTYSTTVTTYNARDQVKQVREFEGVEGSSTYQDTTMSYDGYGRLQNVHRPEQSTGTATTYSYNPDDTVASVTDPRGATTTYAYNGRHLNTSITYNAPFGISIPEPVTYGYDAAANRSWMNESNQRRVTYHYNALSMLEWEDRQFPGLAGEYRLSYEYNLAGQLKKITDPANSAINYVIDRAGRVTDVTGTPYGTGGLNGTSYIEISQYASNLKYRAWGDLKSLTYGNQMTLSKEFDRRLRLVQFLVAGMATPSPGPPNWDTRLISSNFQYYADGKLRFASDNLVSEYARAYSYDQVGGPKVAYSGSEALDFLNGTNSGIASGPYKQTYQFDVFGNMVSRTNRFWSQTDTFSATYTNNLRQGVGISYDADGNLTQDSDLQYSYDAAGRSASIFNPVTNKRISPIYDGDGRVVHRTEIEGSSTIPNFYQVRSSVLGGKVITELDSQGQKKKGYVYCNGQLIARQEPLWLIWQHDNPFTGSRGASNRDGLGAMEVEADPMGVDFGDGDPYIQPELWQPPAEGVVGLLPGSGVPSGRCMLDGMSIECREAIHLMQIGAAEFEHPTVAWDSGSWHFVHYNRDTGQDEIRVQTGFDYTTVTADGQTSGAWHPVFDNVVVGRAGSPIFQLVGLHKFMQSHRVKVPDDWMNNDPDSIGNDTDLCSIKVSFTGSNSLFTNGPAERNIDGVYQGWGVGFTVTGVVKQGEIGKVETSWTNTDVVNPKGAWTLQQWISQSSQLTTDIKSDHVMYTQTLTQPDGPLRSFREINGNKVTYFDFPGPISPRPDGSKINRFRGEFDFAVKLVNGNMQCEVRFHLSMLLQDGAWTAHWGSR